jgi:hypothetical protein
MVNCKHFRSQWSRYWFKELEPEEYFRLQRHLSSCPRCRTYDQQMQAVVGCLKGLSGATAADDLKSERIEQMFEQAYRRYHTAARTRHALAATLLAGFIGGAVFWAAISQLRDEPAYPVISHTQTIFLPVAGVKNISLAIDSDRAVSAVTFTIELPEGVELDGYPGQSRLSWQGQLQAGLNRLTLPLITHPQMREGVLKARIEYEGGGRVLELPLQPLKGSAALNTNTWRYLS